MSINAVGGGGPVWSVGRTSHATRGDAVGDPAPAVRPTAAQPPGAIISDALDRVAQMKSSAAKLQDLVRANGRRVTAE